MYSYKRGTPTTRWLWYPQEIVSLVYREDIGWNVGHLAAWDSTEEIPQ